MFEGGKHNSRTILTGTLKMATVAAALGYGVAIWLSAGGLEQGRLGRVLADLRAGDEPQTTGSISSAKRVQLDPCALSRR
jgi:hypothetical protein